VEGNYYPSPRTFHKAILHNNDMFIIGGFDGEKLNDIWKINLKDVCYHSWNTKPKTNKVLKSSTDANKGFGKKSVATEVSRNNFIDKILKNLDVNEWNEISYDKKDKYIPEPRTGHNIFISNNNLYIIGGMNLNSKVITFDTVHIFNISTGLWSVSKTKGDIPEARSGMQRSKGQSDTLDYENSRFIIFFGGYSANNVILKDLYSFDLQELKWSKFMVENQESSKYKPRLDFSMSEDADEYLIFAGRDNTEVFGDLWKMRKGIAMDRYIMEKVEYGGSIPEKRFGHGAYKYCRHIFLFGGWNGTMCLDDFYEYSCETQLWYEIKLSSGIKPCPRYRFDGDTYNGKLYIFGGVNAKQIRFNDMYEFNIHSRYFLFFSKNRIGNGPRLSPRATCHPPGVFTH
jgi:N-acetylneuraminic acid mutarotase